MSLPPVLACVRSAFIATALLASAVPALAQTAQSFPSKPIRIVVPYTPGGGTDLLARAFGQRLTEYWGQPVLVENRPGAAGWLGITQMAKSPPDGYTIGLTISSIIYAKSLYAKLPFDMATDFEPVSLVSRSAIAWTVVPGFPANTLDEFVALVRKSPGKYSYGSFGQGTSAHIFGETLNLQAKTDMVHAAYKGIQPLVQDLIGGQVSAAFIDTAGVRPLLQAGRVKVLAITGAKRVSTLPDVPTFAEQGYKGFEPVGFFMVLAPAGTPKDVVRKLSDGFARAIRAEEGRMRDLGQEPVGSTPEELATAIKVDAEIFDRAIKASKIQVEQ
jgi:tripartite-type tricarboxylate transporter receptor subunit TctC